MAEILVTDQEIAILCQVLEGRAGNLNAHKSKILDQLVANGFVVLANQGSPAAYKLTGKAQKLLDERGVGLRVSFESHEARAIRRTRSMTEAA
jgi:predicted transcriptional regulator